MMTDERKRLIKDFLVTGFAAILILLLILVVAEWVIFLLVMPFDGLPAEIASRIDSVFPSHGAGFLDGMFTGLEVDFGLAWIEIWIVSFVVVRLIRMQSNRREKNDAADFGTSGRRLFP